MINPWAEDHPDGIVSLGSGVVASQDVQKDFERALVVGSEQLDSFMENRLKSKTQDFNMVLKQNRLKTFATAKKSKAKTAGQALKVDRVTFDRLVVVAQSREIDMKTVLAYPLSPVCAALARCDGMSI